MIPRIASAFSIAALIASEVAAAPTGELKRWHKLSFDFQGPATSETAAVNPFTGYRLNVTFTHTDSGRSYLVPGYYAADGNAANTSATAGNVWRAHFAPDLEGVWTYSVSFREGANIATNESPDAGTSAGFFDGETDGFTITESDKTGRDFRGKGRLEYVGKHHLRFAGSGRYFMKAGTDSPENLLSYADFDGDFKTDGQKDELVKTWSPHLADWQEGDPVWQGDKGKGLIGAINYLASEGLNSFSFLTMNINGDDRNVFPYLTYGERSRMDVSRMDQWEIIFEHGTRMGMHLHFKTQETENESLLDGGDTGNQRKLYYRELIARFGHNLALNWNLGEEINDASLSRKQAWAQYFDDHDPYHHPIVIHNGSSHFDLMGPASKVTGMSLQYNASDFSDTFFQTRRYVNRSVEFGKPWVVGSDEPGDSRLSVRPDNDAGDSHRDARKNALWGNVMAGGAGCEFYFGYDKPESDLTLQNFRSRDAFWDYCRHLLRFYEDNEFSFELMKNHNELVSGNGDNANRCFAKIADSYLIQLHAGGSHTLDLTGVTGSFSTRWFDPRTGTPAVAGNTLEGGGIAALGAPPNSPGEDWIILVKAIDGASGTNAPPVADAGPDRSAILSGDFVEITLNGTVTDDGLPEVFSLSRVWSQISGPAEVTFSNTTTAVTTATFTIPGEYILHLSASDTDLSDTDEVVVTITSAVENNLPPVFAGFAAATLVDQPLVIAFSEILTQAYDPDEDTVSVMIREGSTTSGGEITMGGAALTYTPAIDYTGTDSFALTVEDGRGGSATADLDFTIVESAWTSDRSPWLDGVSTESVGIRFSGVPGLSYGIQRSTTLKNWDTLQYMRTNPSGILEMLDLDPPEGNAFYRIAYP